MEAEVKLKTSAMIALEKLTDILENPDIYERKFQQATATRQHKDANIISIIFTSKQR